MTFVNTWQVHLVADRDKRQVTTASNIGRVVCKGL